MMGCCRIFISMLTMTVMGTPTPSLGLQLAPGAATNDGDCDDIDPTINPAAIELWDGPIMIAMDLIPASIDAQQWFSDTDSDGYGAPNSSQTRCTAPSG